MEEKKATFIPVALYKIGTIISNGYYICKISDATHEIINGKQVIKVDFTVARGRCKGFRLSTKFFGGNPTSTARLSYFCAAVGVTGKLENPEQVTGKLVKLRVKVEQDEHKGRTYKKRIIKRFHSVNK